MAGFTPLLAEDARDGARGLAEALARSRHGRATAVDRPSGGGGLRRRGDGLSEVDAGDVTADSVRAALAELGVLVVRGAADPVVAAELRVAALEACRAVDGLVGLVPGDEAPTTVPFQHDGPLAEHFRNLRPVNRVCQGAMMSDWPQAFGPLIGALAATPLPEALAGYLGEAPSLAVEKTVLRHIPIDFNHDPAPFFPDSVRGWHQDGLLWEHPSAAVNVWLAGERCGGDTGLRGVELLPRPERVRLPAFTDGSPQGYAAAVLDLQRTHPAPHPVLEAGDALVFDGWFVHRTPPEAGYGTSRASAELWFFAPSAFPGRLHPLTLAPTG